MVSGLRYLELFAGAGGLSLGLDAAGLACAAHAEIEPHARAVLRRHWPTTPLLGDVREVRGDAWAVDLVSGGSPCQDLSVAGKRAGLGGARSGLFFEQIRVWEESRAPYFLWENVVGALSSNTGADFAEVLRAVVGAPVPVPADGWGGAGVVAGPTGVAAWRVLDLQWFGPPQRRRRVFVLGARAGGVDPAAVLLEPESVCGHPAPRRDAREGAAARARGRAGEAGRVVAFQDSQSDTRTGDTFGTLDANYGPRRRIGILPIAFDTYNQQDTGDVTQTLCARADTGGNKHLVPAVLAFDWQNSASMGMGCRSESSDSLRTNAVPAVLTVTGEPVTHALTHEGHDASEDGTGRGTPIIALDAQNCGTSADVFATMDTGATKGNRGPQVHAGIPRRLMPVECERLMGWPETRLTAIFSACYEHHESGARAVLRSLKSPACASRADDAESSESALSAALGSLSGPAAPASAVVWRVEIAAELGRVRISNGQREWTHDASTAGARSTFARLVDLARSVPKHVGLLDIAAPVPLRGVAASPASETPSTLPANGSRSPAPSTPETACADAAANVPRKRGRASVKSTTSHRGASSLADDSTWATLCSSVARVIAGFTHGTTSDGSSYLCELTVTDGHTAEGAREDGTRYRLSDAARYKLCGNGVGAPVAEWIGRRLAALHAALAVRAIA